MRHIFRYILVAVGTLSCVLGIIGIFVPVLPTTPFLLLSAALYFRSSPKLYRLLLNHRTLGPYIKNFREHKSIPLRVKIISVSMVWISLLHCAFLFSSDWVISASFIVLAVLLTVYLLHFKHFFNNHLHLKFCKSTAYRPNESVLFLPAKVIVFFETIKYKHFFIVYLFISQFCMCILLCIFRNFAGK